MTDRLVEINRNELHHLKSIYEANNLETYIAYMTICNYIRWFENDSNIENLKFYCLNGDFSDGSFIVTDPFYVYADTIDESSGKLYHMLLLLDYSKNYVFANVRAKVADIIADALQKVVNAKITGDVKTILYRLPKEEALQFDVQPSEGVELRPLVKIHDLEKVNSMWTYGNDHTLPFFRLLSKLNANVGAFREDGTLMAWIFHLQSGMMGVLQTDEKYTRRGYGAMVIKSLSKRVARMGFDVQVEIVESNTPSMSLFEKLGFKPIAKLQWIVTKGAEKSEDIFSCI